MVSTELQKHITYDNIQTNIMTHNKARISHMGNENFSDVHSYSFKRITLSDVVEERFYKIPKFLFVDPFKHISNDAKVAYALLRDRNELSIKNSWVNDRGEVYLLFTRADLQELLNVSKNTCTKIMKELVDHNLITEEKLGDRKPNMIYVNTIEIADRMNTSSESQKLGHASPKIRDSLVTKFGTRESQKMGLNDTNNYLTDSIDTNQSIEKTDDGLIGYYKEKIDRYSFEELAIQLDMIYLIDIHPDDQQSQFKAELLRIITDELNKPSNIVYLNRDNHVSKAAFEKRVLELKSSHFDYVYESFTNRKETVKNVKNYLLTMIYNSSTTMNAYYQNRISSELGIV